MENNSRQRLLSSEDQSILIKALMSSSFFKEQLRKAWSSGRMFDMEQYKNRSVDTDIKDVPDKALNFEEWFLRHIKK
jgi:hypothetical protein